MVESGKGQSRDFTLCVALRHLGVEREILVLKHKENNFYAFPPYSKKPLGCVDTHMSLHASGERHAVWRFFDGRVWKQDAKMRQESTVKLKPPSELNGVVPLFHSGIFLGQFVDLPPVGTNMGDLILLDAEGANFRDDFMVARIYLVEPGAEHNIPRFPETGPRILHLDKRIIPWVAIEVYQQVQVECVRAQVPPND